MTSRTFAEAEAVLATNLPGYAPRINQQLAAQAVEVAFATGQHLLLNAGCGTGKSIAVLIPAIQDGRRVVVSTATKALQNQYAEKDIPFLAEHLGTPFRFAVLMGRSNYFCSNRAALVAAEDDRVPALIAISQEPGFGGLKDDFGTDIPSGLWSKICGNTDECGELGCKTLGGCFVLGAREDAMNAQVVLVNHALLATDIAIENNPLLGKYEVVVVDEVHELADQAIKAFEVKFSHLTVKNLQSQVRSFAIRAYGGNDKLDEASRALSQAATLLWISLTEQMPKSEPQLRITPTVRTASLDEFNGLSAALWAYARVIEALPLPTESADDAKRYRLLRKQAQNLAVKFEGLAGEDFDSIVRWMEWGELRGEKYLVLISQPIEVGPFLQDKLFEGRVVVGASATTTVGGRFDTVANQLGLTNGDYRGVDVGTNFDFATQALTYIPALPAPTGQTVGEWEAALPGQIAALLQASQGRALVLFTSNRQLDRVYNAVAPLLPWTVLRQGLLSQAQTVEAFKADTHSVLFATKTFFTGIDIQGEALSMVILDKMPFPNPKNPVVEATSELFDRRYGERGGFNRYSIPSAQMAMEQAFGRLIRTVNDRGVFACLDSRLLKGYGAGMASKLPKAPRTKDFSLVQAFFGTGTTPIEEAAF